MDVQYVCVKLCMCVYMCMHQCPYICISFHSKHVLLSKIGNDRLQLGLSNTLKKQSIPLQLITTVIIQVGLLRARLYWLSFSKYRESFRLYFPKGTHVCALMRMQYSLHLDRYEYV